MPTLKKLTLLHSNDMHGDFLAEQLDETLVGGVSMLSGYVKKAREEEENVVYAVSGDMFRGSLIDSEYQGLSTIEIMNHLNPDVVTVGNHEVDYGVAHLLFIEKCANFPIVNANMYLTSNGKRLFSPHHIMNVGGMKIMFIGILTEDVLGSTRTDRLIGSLVDVADAANEVGKIVNAYQTEDVDLTVLLTHIGFEEDKKLAAMLDPAWGVDVIVGGHSHTLIEEPAVVNGIPIVQAACGTDQLGRFDIVVNTDTNSLHSYEWQLIPINSENCPRDLALEEIIQHFKDETDQKYNRIICSFKTEYTHPVRNRETELGKIFADAFKDQLGVDIVLLGSGSIRGEKLGPNVTLEGLKQIFPYGDAIHRITINGKQLRECMEHIFRPEAWRGDHTEFFQFSRGLYMEFNTATGVLEDFAFNGGSVRDTDVFDVAVQYYHFKNCADSFNLVPDDLDNIKKSKVIATNCVDVLEEYFGNKGEVRVPNENRLVLI